MVSIRPVDKALIPIDQSAAEAIFAPNYDEFQSDDEVFAELRERPDNVLKVTMPHVAVPSASLYLEEGSDEALRAAAVNMRHLIEHVQTKTLEDVLFVYAITSDHGDHYRQIGLGGFAKTSEIRTDETPEGCIIRNEGIRPEKAEGRAKLIEATRSYIGIVNCVVPDESGEMLRALEEFADVDGHAYHANTGNGETHHIWFAEGEDAERLSGLLAKQKAAYVADGNHRSAAAAALGKEDFLAVFFTADRMNLAPYNRLVPDVGVPGGELKAKLAESFDVSPAPESPYAPKQVGDVGLYVGDGQGGGEWLKLTAKPGTFDAEDAAASIDAAVVQKCLFDAALGITDPKDKRLNFVGGNKDAAWLQSRVDAGDYALAVSLAPVTMDQFMAVCEQNRFMPPKSTWFVPKIRSGLVMALLDEEAKS